MIKKAIKKLQEQDGSAEVIGFITTLPVLVFIVIMVITVIQNGLIHENLEYTAYMACRAAVIREDKKTAIYAANEAAKKSMETTPAVYKTEPIASITVIEGSGKKGAKWEKGNYVRCEVSVDVEAPLGGTTTKTASIVMMIERPASDALGEIFQTG